MKNLIPFIALLLFTASVSGQSRIPEVKVVAVKMEVVSALVILKRIEEPGRVVARLYRRPKAEIKKALSFSTPGNRAKVA